MRDVPDPIASLNDQDSSGIVQTRDNADFAELQRVFDCVTVQKDYVTVHKGVRISGIGSIGAGILNIVIGLAGVEENAANYVVVAIGILMCCSGLWLAIVTPSPRWLALDGLGLLAVGTWNVVVGFSGNPHDFQFWPRLGCMQVFWAIQAFVQAARFWHLPSITPTAATLELIRNLQNEVSAVSSADDGSVMELQVQPRQGWDSQYLKLKLKLCDGYAVGLVAASFPTDEPVDTVFAPKSKISVQNDMLVIGNRHYTIIDISDDALHRYEYWKLGQEGIVAQRQAQGERIAFHRRYAGRAAVALAGSMAIAIIALVVGAIVSNDLPPAWILVVVLSLVGITFLWTVVAATLLAESLGKSGLRYSIGMVVGGGLSYGLVAFLLIFLLRRAAGKAKIDAPLTASP